MNMTSKVNPIFFVGFLARDGLSLNLRECLALGENHFMPILESTPVIVINHWKTLRKAKI